MQAGCHGFAVVAGVWSWVSAVLLSGLKFAPCHGLPVEEEDQKRRLLKPMAKEP